MHQAVWAQQTWAENLGAPPFLGKGAVSPSNTKSPGLRPSSIPSGILVHRAIWPQWKWPENWRGLCPLFGEGAGSTSKTTRSPGLWPIPPCQVRS